MKKLLVVLSVVLLALAVCVTPVAAHSSGPLAESTDKTKIEVPNFNFGSVCNSVFALGNSGWNQTFGWGVNLTTGNATVNGGLSTGLNSNGTGILLADMENGPIALNMELPEEEDDLDAFGSRRYHRGPVAIAYDGTKIKVKNVNVGFVYNRLGLMANTGGNYTVGGHPSVTTGNARVTANVGTTLNTNTTSVALVESGMGPMAVNFQYGEDCRSKPFAMAIESDKIEVENFNFGMVNNKVLSAANSGNNRTYSLWGGTSVTTGNAGTTSNVTSNVNSNTTTVMKEDSASGPVAVNVGIEDNGCAGNLTNGQCVPLVGTVGPVAANIGTSGTAIAKEEDKVEVTNTNMAQVTNTVVSTANTGGNTTGCSITPCEPTPSPVCGNPCPDSVETSFVIPSTTVSTGDATVTTSVTNTVNTNETTVVIIEGGN